MPIIEVDHVTKEFQLGQLISLKQSVVNSLKRLAGRPVEKRSPFKALDDVNFSVEQGEVLGIIGHNGAGKSTLLKFLAGISRPTSGRVTVIGKVAPLIEVGAGMVTDLTGRENIHLNCTILGIQKREIARKFDQIVDFAELEEFIDTPIKRYSSGMKVKLGFAIATSIEAEILIVDEVLAVGDLAFQRKCFDRMEDMIKRQGRTVLVVSHNIRQVERLCTRVILLDHGKIVADGQAKQVCDLFYEQSDARIRIQSTHSPGGSLGDVRHRSGEVELLSATLLNSSGAPINTILPNAMVSIRLTFEAKTELQKPIIGLGIHTTDMLFLATEESDAQLSVRTVGPGVFSVLFHIRRFPFLPGVYSVRTGIRIGESGSGIAYYAEGVIQFQVASGTINRARSMNEGFVPLEGSWELEPGGGQFRGAQAGEVCTAGDDSI
jgi:lipopolysaccharide transport system ATP-binding protein